MQLGFKIMENARAVSATFLGAFITTFGTWTLNGLVVVVSDLLGKTGWEAYSFAAVESLLRFVFYVVIGVSVALVAGKKRTVVLAITGAVSLIVLVMNSQNWMEPSMGTYAKVTMYLIVYSPTFAMVPAFILDRFCFLKVEKRNLVET